MIAFAARPLPIRPPAFGEGRVAAAVIGDVDLDGGQRLRDVTIAYRHDGAPPPAPQVVVVHALTGSADAAGDWWEPLIGPGRALDTERIGVLCSNLLGGRYGSTGPVSMDRRTGRPYAEAFPAVTVRDQARVIWRLLDVLGISRLDLVVGGSLGGMVALEVALERPSRVRTVMPIAAPAATGAMAIAWDHIQLALIRRMGVEGMALARQLAMITYRSGADLDGRFGRRQEDGGGFAVTSYLDHQGRKLLERFDPQTYAALAGAMDTHDVGRDRGGTVAALRRLALADTRLVGVGIEGDILYGPPQVRELVRAARSARVRTRYRHIRSTKGHDAFLVEWDQLERILRQTLCAGAVPTG